MMLEAPSLGEFRSERPPVYMLFEPQDPFALIVSYFLSSKFFVKLRVEV